MTLPVISILILVAVVLWWLRWRKTGAALLLIAVLLFVTVGCGPVPTWMLSDLQTGYSAANPAAAPGGTAIVLLGNGTERVAGSDVEVGVLAYGRLVKALELYQGCKRLNDGGACVLLVTGGDPEHFGASEAAVYGARLRGLGVDPADLVLEERSLNTFQNAQYSAPLLSAHPVGRILLVTSGIHIRRSLLYFAHFGIAAQPVRADYVSAMPSALPVSYNFLVADLALHEYEGVLRYHVYQFMGWNVQAKKPGSL